MGHAFMFAALLGLIAFAFGQGAAVILARVIVIGGLLLLLLALFVAYLIIGERI